MSGIPQRLPAYEQLPSAGRALLCAVRELRCPSGKLIRLDIMFTLLSSRDRLVAMSKTRAD